jgi:hypothetical protein
MLAPLTFPKRALNTLISAISLVVFALLDLLDILLCYVYRILDEYLEESPIRCYCCRNSGKEGSLDEELSETLHERENIFRKKLFVGSRREDEVNGGSALRHSRWSDCCCDSCISCQGKRERKLHVVTNLPNQGLFLVLLIKLFIIFKLLLYF